MNLVGLFVDGQCRYDGELPFLNEQIWSYPEREQEEDFFDCLQCCVERAVLLRFRVSAQRSLARAC